jgi:hypothetical protein
MMEMFEAGEGAMGYRIAVLMMVILLAACDSGGDPPPTTVSIPTDTPTETSIPLTETPTPTPLVQPRTTALDPADQASVRLIHAVPGLPPVSFFIEALSVAPNLNFGQVTGVTSLEAGEYNLRIMPQGERVTSQVPPVLAQSVIVAGGETRVLMLAGLPESPSLVTFAENQEPLEENTSRVTYVQAFPESPSLALVQGGENLAEPLNFGQIAPAVSLPAEPALFQVLAEGQEIINRQISLRQRYSYTLVVTGDINDAESWQIIEFSTQVPGWAGVRAVHGSPDMGPVDVYVGETAIATGLDFTRFGAWQRVVSGSYTAYAYAPGSDEPLAQLPLNVNPDADATLLLLGDADQRILVRHLEDLSPLPAGQTRITFVNALTEYPSARLRGQGDTPIGGINTIASRRVAGPVTVDAGEYAFFWQGLDRANTVVDFVERTIDVELEAGRSYLYLMTGSGDDAVPVILGDTPGVVETGVDESAIEAAIPDMEPTYVRLANMLVEGMPLDFFIGDISLVTSLEYGTITAPILVPEGVYDLSVQVSGTGEPVLGEPFEFFGESDNTLYVYGYTAENAALLPLRNPLPNETSATVRLVNLTPSRNVLLDLSVAQTGSEAINVTASATEEAAPATNRSPLTVQALKLFRDQAGGSASPTTSLPFNAVDFYIIDADVDLVAAVLPEQVLQPGGHYDVVAVEMAATGDMLAIVIDYSRP